MDRDV